MFCWTCGRIAGRRHEFVPVRNWASRSEEVWELEVYLHVFLTSIVDGGERLASDSGHFTSVKRTPVSHKLVRRLCGFQRRFARRQKIFAFTRSRTPPTCPTCGLVNTEPACYVCNCKQIINEFHIFLTVHLRIILVSDQHDAQFFYNMFIWILRATLCSSSGIITLRWWPSGMPDGHQHRVIIPEVVLMRVE